MKPMPKELIALAMVVGMAVMSLGLYLNFVDARAKDAAAVRAQVAKEQRLADLIKRAKESVARQQKSMAKAHTSPVRSQRQVSVRSLKVRDKPAKQASVVGSLILGTVVPVQEVGKWGKIGPGQYIHLGFTRKLNASANILQVSR